MTRILVLIIGLAIIGFIVWWFFGNHQVATATAAVSENNQNVDIEVNGGYSPEVYEKRCFKLFGPSSLFGFWNQSRITTK